MSTTGNPASILVVRLGAMGDIIHALPAVACLKQCYPAARLTWVVEPKWAPLLEGNPDIDRVVLLRRRQLRQTWRDLRSEQYDVAIDFQGLYKSALIAAASGASRIVGFDQCRERPAAVLYTQRIRTDAVHVVDRNLDLAGQASEAPGKARPAGRPLGQFLAGVVFPLPQGLPEGSLPPPPFVLASPLAGWRSKQWPLEHYWTLAERLNQIAVPLVVDIPPAAELESSAAVLHRSTLRGLIYATRHAAAVVGVDSGPLHLAAALGRPGVALFGPTDPARNGPYGSSLQVLRSGAAVTTYKRRESIDDSMRQITPDQVFEALRPILGRTA